MSATSDRTPFAVILILASVLLFSGADAAVKAVSGDYSLWQIYVARSTFAGAILLILLSRSGTGHRFQIARPWVLFRSLLLVGTWVAYYAALPSTDLSVAATAFYTTPLFIACLSALFAGEPVGRDRWIGIAMGFLGVLVILRPGADDFSIWTLLPLAAAVLYAFAAVVTRTRCTSDNPLVLALALQVCLLVTGIIGVVSIAMIEPAPSDPFLLGGWTAMDERDWVIMAALGVIQGVGAAGVAKAYQSGAPAVVGTFDYGYLVFAVVWGVLFFSEALDALTLAGILLIVVAGLIVLKLTRLQADGSSVCGQQEV